MLKNFVQSSKTDAILVVETVIENDDRDDAEPVKKMPKLEEGCDKSAIKITKLYVNKALLSYHSDYFKSLFNSEFKEELMPEISIKDVNLDDLATVLSLIQNNSISCDEYKAERLLGPAKKFKFVAVEKYLERIFILSTKNKEEKLKIADRLKLDALLSHVLAEFKTKEDFYIHRRKPKPELNREFKLMDKRRISWQSFVQEHGMVWVPRMELFDTLSDETNAIIFHKMLQIDFKRKEEAEKTVKIETPDISIYESTFAKSDKTDAILVVQGKKMHVSKALLSYHSDYFQALFNSNFKEKSMREIPIDEAEYDDLATLFSIVQLQPIKPTDENAERVLELADRFLMQGVRYQLEKYLISSSLERLEKIRIAEKYQLTTLLSGAIYSCSSSTDFEKLDQSAVYHGFTDKTKKLLFHRYLCVRRRS